LPSGSRFSAIPVADRAEQRVDVDRVIAVAHDHAAGDAGGVERAHHGLGRAAGRPRQPDDLVRLIGEHRGEPRRHRMLGVVLLEAHEHQPADRVRPGAERPGRGFDERPAEHPTGRAAAELEERAELEARARPGAGDREHDGDRIGHSWKPDALASV
jgi:hypothetical protein